MLDTTRTLRGAVNQCVGTYNNFSHFSQQSFISSSCCCRLSLMPTSLIIVLMTTTVMCSILDGCPCSGHSLMWWSPNDGDGVWLMMMQLWSWLDDALCLHSLHWCMWLDPMPYDALEPWVLLMMKMTLHWFVDGDDMMMSCLDSLMEMPWWCLAMIVDADDISCLDMLMYLVDEDMIHSCWWDVDELMSLVMRYPIPFHSPTLALALPILAIPCKTLLHPSYVRIIG